MGCCCTYTHSLTIETTVETRRVACAPALNLRQDNLRNLRPKCIIVLNVVPACCGIACATPTEMADALSVQSGCEIWNTNPSRGAPRARYKPAARYRATETTRRQDACGRRLHAELRGWSRRRQCVTKTKLDICSCN